MSDGSADNSTHALADNSTRDVVDNSTRDVTDNNTRDVADGSVDNNANDIADNGTRDVTDSSVDTGGHTAADTGRAGVILAAGPSTGFPTIEKALAPLDDTPLLAHATATLEPIVDELVITCRVDQRDAFAEVVGNRGRLVSRPADGYGPRAELHAALKATDATYAAVLPVGMPLLPTGFVELLFAQARTETGAVPSVEGHQRSVPAVMHVRAAAAACVDARQATKTTIAAVIAELAPVVVPNRTVAAHVEADAFTTIDTHEELAAVQPHRSRPNNNPSS